MVTETRHSPYSEDDNDNGLFSDDNVQASMMEFGKGMQNIMEIFKACTERISARRSNTMSNYIEETRELRNMFREFVKDSLDFNKCLENYSLDILFFVKCFKDSNNYSDEDILVLLNDLLEKSQENHMLAKELKNGIKTDEGSGINDRLTQIQNSLPNCIDEINGEIESSSMSALIPRGGGLVSSVTRYFGCLVLAKFGVRHLLDRLNELIVVKDFDGNLSLIITKIGKIETFWVMQIERIEYLISNLQPGRNDIRRRQIVHNLEQKWKDVKKECQIYNRAMRDVLTNDSLAYVE